MNHLKTQKLRHAAGIAVCLLLALYMLITLYMTVSPAQAGEELSLAAALSQAFSSFTWAPPILYLLLSILSGITLLSPDKKDPHPFYTAAAAAFLTFCMLLGRAFIDPDWAHLVIRNDIRCVVKWLFCLPGWFFLCFSIVRLLYLIMDACAQHPSLTRRRHTLFVAFDAHPFTLSFLILLVCYAPVTILSLPGLVEAGDTVSQIVQFYGGIPGGHDRIYPDSMLTNHHPILHTLLLHIFLEAGRLLFSSAQTGLALLTILQVLLTCSALAYALKQLYQEGVPGSACMAAALFLGLHPRIQNFIVLLSKDMLYAVFLLLFGIAIIRVLKGQKPCFSLLITSSLGCMFMRNEGIYILIGTLVVMLLLHKKARRHAAAALLLCAAIWIVWTDAVFPALQISPGSKREMFSIPFQQTGRVVARSGDKVTTEEREAIDAVLQYDHIAHMYQPNLADGVKNLYRQEAADGAMSTYLKTWFSMFFKHPMVYIEAFLENKNLFLYPTPSITGAEDTAKYYETSALDFRVINEDCAAYGISLSYPTSLEKARTTYERARETLFSLPILRLLTQSAPIVWASVLLLLYALSRRKWESLLLLIPVLLQILVIFAGPTDGWLFRYIYPVALYLPVCLFYSIYVDTKKPS